MTDAIPQHASKSSDSSVTLSPNIQAALLLTARGLLKQHQLATPTAAAIIEATGATRSRAYELSDALEQTLPSLSRPVGRPPKDDIQVPFADIEPVMAAVIDYMQRHPGCVAGERRLRYSDDFRRFIIALLRQHADIPLARFAEAVGVPLGTLEDWRRRAGQQDTDATDANAADPATDANAADAANGAAADALSSQTAEPAAGEPEPRRVTTARIESVLLAYESWQGSFVGFCEYVRQQLRIPYGRTLISRILEMYEYRTPRRRPGRAPDADALRGAFVRFFPGAQWVGDGTKIEATVNGERFRFNLELEVDAADGAFVGASVRDEEDARAVIEAYGDGVRNTDTIPLANLLDNRPSNHTEEVREALGDTRLIRATPGRPENKAHVEGGFGLFEQTAPPLELRGETRRELARSFLICLVKVWGRTINHRPMRRRGGLSRVQLYRAACPTPEQIAEARAELAALMRRQEQAYATRTARLDPAKFELVSAAFARLGLDDDDGNQLHFIAGYPRDAIVEGIAIFEAKRAAGRLPRGAGARYLRGIVKNLAESNELYHLTETLIRWRQEARDIALRILESELDDVRRSVDGERVMAAMLERALAAERLLDRKFWLRAIADFINACPEPERAELLREAATHIRLAYSVPRDRREEAIRYVTRVVFPVA